MKFKVGDRVSLKTGHPIGSGDAIVSDMDTNDMFATLLWTSEDGTQWNSASPVDDLELVTKSG
jgi:hypothetical protein